MWAPADSQVEGAVGGGDRCGQISRGAAPEASVNGHGDDLNGDGSQNDPKKGGTGETRSCFALL